MGLESATYINGLVETNPTSSDNANQGDNHLRLIKAAIKATFPNITGPVTATQATLNTPYLPLAGGTLTGGLSGTTATFSGGLTGTTATFSGLLTGSTGTFSGNVGLGTASPKTRAQVSAGGFLNAPVLGSATGAPLYVTNSDPAYGLLVGVAADDGHAWLQAQRTDGTALPGNISLNEAGGNVAIGKATASTKLDVNGTVTATAFSGPLTGAVTGNASTATVLQTARTINGVSFNGSANISFGTDAVAEGTTNLYFTNTRARGAISVTGAGSYNSATGVITVNAAPVSSVAGKTGAVTLAIADTSGLQSALDGKFSASGGTISGNVSVSGTVTATGDITAFSDSRTKMNIETITEALYKVKAMRGVSYISKFNMEERIGVIAQEVERVVPEVVHTHTNGLKSVAYQNLVGLLIEAIKALELRVAELEDR